MRSAPSLSRRCALLIAIISPALLGSQFRCAVVSNSSVATAHIVELEPATLRVGDILHATGTGTGNPPLEFAWDFGDGTRAVGSQAAHVYTAPGSYRVTLTVRDAVGHAAGDASQVVVSARISSAAPLILISDAVAGRPVAFAALGLEEDVSVGTHTYVWAFSHGQAAAGPEVAAIFPVAGLYFGSLIVMNDFGAIAVARFPLQVVDAPP